MLVLIFFYSQSLVFYPIERLAAVAHRDDVSEILAGMSNTKTHTLAGEQHLIFLKRYGTTIMRLGIPMAMLFLSITTAARAVCGFIREPASARTRRGSVFREAPYNPENGSGENSSSRLENGIDKDLMFPAITLRKESILFGENPTTRKNSNALRAWRATKQFLPFVVTGARTPTTADDNPIAGFYNMIFVRVPTIAAGLVYVKNSLTGHPLVIDVGFGASEVNPVIVGAVLFAILR